MCVCVKDCVCVIPLLLFCSCSRTLIIMPICVCCVCVGGVCVLCVYKYVCISRKCLGAAVNRQQHVDMKCSVIEAVKL